MMISRLLPATSRLFGCHSLVKCANSRNFSSSSVLLASDRLYTKKHEWISLNGSVGTIGISSFAQEALGDVVYVELPEVGQKLQQGDAAGAIESVKAASDVYSPVTGVVTERNKEVESKPHLINKSTYDKGWLYKLELTDNKELQQLMDETTYEKYCSQEQSDSNE